MAAKDHNERKRMSGFTKGKSSPFFAIFVFLCGYGFKPPLNNRTLS